MRLHSRVRMLLQTNSEHVYCSSVLVGWINAFAILNFIDWAKQVYASSGHIYET